MAVLECFSGQETAVSIFKKDMEIHYEETQDESIADCLADSGVFCAVVARRGNGTSREQRRNCWKGSVAGKDAKCQSSHKI